MKLEKFDLDIIKFALDSGIDSFKNLVKATGSENAKAAIGVYERVLAKVEKMIAEENDGKG